jgi:hypothetical protein
MAYHGYYSQLSGVEVAANFHLKYPYEFIENIQQLRDLELGPKRLILVDEAWASGMDSRTPGSKTNILFSKFLLQARKKKANVLHSNQLKRQLDVRLRENTSVMLIPNITMSLIEATGKLTTDAPDPDRGIVPYMMNIRFHDRWLNYMDYQDFYMVYPCHLLYETNEVIDETRAIDYEALKKKYWDYQGSKNGLISLLRFHEKPPVDPKDARSFADYLMALKTNEYLDEIKPKIKKKAENDDEETNDNV